MVFVYIRIYFAARARTRRAMENRILRQTLNKNGIVDNRTKSVKQIKLHTPNGQLSKDSNILREKEQDTQETIPLQIICKHPSITKMDKNCIEETNSNLNSPIAINESIDTPETEGVQFIDRHTRTNKKTIAKDQSSSSEQQQPDQLHTTVPLSNGGKPCVSFDCEKIDPGESTKIHYAVSSNVITNKGRRSSCSLITIAADCLRDYDSRDTRLPTDIKFNQNDATSFTIRRTSLFFLKKGALEPRRAISDASNISSVAFTSNRVHLDSIWLNGNEAILKSVENKSRVCTCPTNSTDHENDIQSDTKLAQPDNLLENETPTEIEPSSSDSGTVARCVIVRPLKIRFCRPGSASKKSSKAKRQVCNFISQFNYIT